MKFRGFAVRYGENHLSAEQESEVRARECERQIKRERQREKQESVRIERDINNSRMTHRKTFVVFAISIDAFIWEFGVMAAVGQSRIENPQSYSERQLNESNLLQNNVN